ncbi:GNAT family N-acetyltransferase [Rhodococcus artemisiae]|uniref:GNAT family protein n=1 Tax=Rhodococcus artemisiae TaxID=714159 RepID=A0ABU7LE39_9NOCA|nr:GNAT family protein [Rhodococcus artemisiae]MEE2059549.1 GNAT family protein [Rhodococcus artemisiae]
MLQHGDARAFAAGTEDEDVRLYGHLPLSDYTPAIVEEQIDGVIADGLEDGSLAVLAIADRSSDDLLGSIVLFDVRGERAEVGFWLAPLARGRGVARKSLAAIVRVAAEAGLSVLDARTVPENEASRRVLEAAGFERRGDARTGTSPSGAAVTALAFERSVVGGRP